MWYAASVAFSCVMSELVVVVRRLHGYSSVLDCNQLCSSDASYMVISSDVQLMSCHRVVCCPLECRYSPSQGLDSWAPSEWSWCVCFKTEDGESTNKMSLSTMVRVGKHWSRSHWLSESAASCDATVSQRAQVPDQLVVSLGASIPTTGAATLYKHSFSSN
jgi:hypothetical protein